MGSVSNSSCCPVHPHAVRISQHSSSSDLSDVWFIIDGRHLVFYPFYKILRSLQGNKQTQFRVRSSLILFSHGRGQCALTLETTSKQSTYRDNLPKLSPCSASTQIKRLAGKYRANVGRKLVAFLSSVLMKSSLMKIRDYFLAKA